jgi:AcrR family transcriptional regulator
VIKAARTLFLQRGFAATSMDAIALAAGMSKSTFYIYFSNKEALFASVFLEACATLEQSEPHPDLSMGLEAALRQLAHRCERLWTEHENLTLMCAIARESSRFPALSSHFYERSHSAIVDRIALFLESARDRGLLKFDDPVMAAVHFVSLVIGERPLRIMLGIADFSEAFAGLHIESGLSLFLKAYSACTSVKDF